MTADAGHAVGDNSVLASYMQCIECGSNDGIAVVTGIIDRIAIFDDNALKGTAIMERMTADAGHAVGDSDGSQAIAARERPLADRGHAVGDGDRGQATAIIERLIADGGYAVGNGSVLASHHKSIRRCFNEGIAVVTGIIDSITIFYRNAFKTTATKERRTVDAGHAVADGDGGQATATTERRKVDAGHAVRDGE